MSLEKSYATQDDETEYEQRSLLAYVIDVALKPFDILFSRTARRAYLTTFLIFFTAIVLLGIAITAYTLFYWSYIPQIGFERTIHLQFHNVLGMSDSGYDSAANPYGIVSLGRDVVSDQRYDVLVELSLPRTPDNRNAGNFMLEASMFASESIVDPIKDSLVAGTAKEDNRLATSRRPAILTYRSRPTEAIYALTELHWYLLGWRKEAESLSVSMFEGVEFARGWRNVPATMKLVIQSTNRMQIYSAKAIFEARFRGLRYLMYNHRIISAIVFTSGFWMTEMLFAGLAWAVIQFYVQQPSQTAKADQVQEMASSIKQEGKSDEEAMLSDTERTFPTSSKQQALRYQSPSVKQEEEDDAVVLPEASTRATEADDEEDDEDVAAFRDSGIGTSLESSAGRRDSVRRRKSRPGTGDR